MKTPLVIAACLLLGGAVSPAKELVSVRVSPNVSVAPATIRVIVTVEPDANNRQLLVQADSGEFYTSSTIQLDGSSAPRLQLLEFKELPAGTYAVEARVFTRNGDQHKATAEYMIM